MVFISLEDVVGVTNAAAVTSTRSSKRSGQAELPIPTTNVVVTPGSPAKQLTQSSRARGRFGLASTQRTPATPQYFVLYVTDSIAQQKWVLSKTSSDHAQLRKAVHRVAGGCKASACCGPLRRLLKAPLAAGLRRKRGTNSAHLTQFGQCSAFQEFLNDLMPAVLGRDVRCDSTRRAQHLLEQFLEITHHRADAADRIMYQATTPCVEECPDSQDDGSASEDSSECPICCSELADDKTLRLPCGHLYHSGCVRVWLNVQHTCPVCRLQLDLATIPC
ncbi:hypothetical protein BBJ28_00013006 [Nothophytophthora sp. Chile5]|nr:hypothetical protein BBJ28_00013006 [Nothophytophthora sp. Chile5]